MSERIPALAVQGCHVTGWSSPRAWPLPAGADLGALTLAQIVEAAKMAGFSQACERDGQIWIGLHDEFPRNFQARIELVP